jgi:hypothetical protein
VFPSAQPSSVSCVSCTARLQTDLTEVGLGDPSVPPPQFIKPDHLSSIITCSHGDFLVVVGDKNMKNDTCQVGGRRAREEEQRVAGSASPRLAMRSAEHE